jgi:hypothetical protein
MERNGANIRNERDNSCFVDGPSARDAKARAVDDPSCEETEGRTAAGLLAENHKGGIPLPATRPEADDNPSDAREARGRTLMKPHLEERNKRIRDEYFARIGKGENKGAVVDDISEREHVAFATALYIATHPGYGMAQKETAGREKNRRGDATSLRKRKIHENHT